VRIRTADRYRTTPSRLIELASVPSADLVPGAIVALVDNFLGQIQLNEADYDRAAQLFTAGLDAAGSSPDRFSILISLYDLALASQARGDLDGAAGLLRQGLSLAAETGDESAAAYYLEALAAIARQQDDLQCAARQLAAAGALLQVSGSGWPHAYVPRALHDDSIEAELRSRIGDAAYEQAAAHGPSLTGTRAIQDALQDAQQGPERQETRVKHRPAPSANLAFRPRRRPEACRGCPGRPTVRAQASAGHWCQSRQDRAELMPAPIDSTAAPEGSGLVSSPARAITRLRRRS
jgi:tetratricopeptide (TPR) repeat protein